MRGLLMRQRLLLAVIGELFRQGRFSRTALEKTLFLLSREHEGALAGLKFYSFFPYKYGPFSNVSYQDVALLQREGFLEESCAPTGKAQGEIARVDAGFVRAAEECVSRFQNDAALVRHVYEKYPVYTVRSELKERKEERREPAVFTIGYEGKDIDAFLDRLVQNRVEVLVDIRNNPFSMNFAFVKSKLEGHMKKAGIEYVHIGGLGIESGRRRGAMKSGDYATLFAEYESGLRKNAELERVVELGKAKRVALMCFERDEHMCHRSIVAKALRERGLKVAAL